MELPDKRNNMKTTGMIHHIIKDDEMGMAVMQQKKMRRMIWC